MALDTSNKRASAGGFGPLALSLPVPDAAISAGDREQVAALYRGLAAGESGGGTAAIMRPWKIRY